MRKFLSYNFFKSISLNYGNIGIYAVYPLRIYFYILQLWLKKIKFFFQKYINFFISFQIWIKLHWNFPFFKKSKNSRMGKGGGNFFSWIICLTKSLNFVELNLFQKYSIIILLKLLFLIKIGLYLKKN